VSEQPILMPEHSNWAILENAKLRAKSVAANRMGHRDQLTSHFWELGLLYDFDPHFLLKSLCMIAQK